MEKNVMKAFILDKYKKNGALRFGEMPEPALRDERCAINATIRIRRKP